MVWRDSSTPSGTGRTRSNDPAVAERAKAQRVLRQLVRQGLRARAVATNDPLWSGPATGRFPHLAAVTATAERLGLEPCILHRPYLASLPPEGLETALVDCLDTEDVLCAQSAIRLLARGLSAAGVTGARAQTAVWTALLTPRERASRAVSRARRGLRAALEAGAATRAGLALAALATFWDSHTPSSGPGNGTDAYASAHDAPDDPWGTVDTLTPLLLLQAADHALADSRPHARVLAHVQARLAQAYLAHGHVAAAVDAATRALGHVAAAPTAGAAQLAHAVLLEAYVELGDLARAYLEASQAARLAHESRASLSVRAAASVRVAEAALALGTPPRDALAFLPQGILDAPHDAFTAAEAGREAASVARRAALVAAYAHALAGDATAARAALADAGGQAAAPARPVHDTLVAFRPPALTVLTCVAEARLLLAEGRSGQAYAWLAPLFARDPAPLAPADLDALTKVLLSATARDVAASDGRHAEVEAWRGKMLRARQARPLGPTSPWSEVAHRMVALSPSPCAPAPHRDGRAEPDAVPSLLAGFCHTP